MSKETLYGARWKTGDGLGEGGQGHVFRAVDITGQLKGEFALKRVRNLERHERFRNEIDAIKRLSHPNIISLIDHSALSKTTASDERPFLVMPIANGGDLSDPDRLSIYTGSVEAVLQVAQQIASALDAAHEAGVIHRDVKPKNILFTGRGHNIWVSDFGVCLIRDEDRSTDIGEVVGARGFMAPELENGGRLDVTPAADVYSFGKLIFYMFSGGITVPRETVHEDRYNRLFAGGERPQRLRFLLGRMVSSLDRRLKTMKEVIEGLRTLEEWEQKAHVPLISADGLAAIEELRQRSHNVRRVAAENESAREQEQRTLLAVKEGFESWLKAELEIVASRFGSDENIEAVAGEIGDLGKELRLVAANGTRGYVPVTARELRVRTAEDNFQRIHRLRVQLCEGPKTLVRATVRVLGLAGPKPTIRPVEDSPLAMIPVYFQTLLGRSSNMHSPLAGFLTKSSALGIIQGQLVQPGRNGGAPVLQGFRADKVMRTFHPELSQYVPFRASEWLNVNELLSSGLREAIDLFVDFVVSGATHVGP